jgi:hypothetical protein
MGLMQSYYMENTPPKSRQFHLFLNSTESAYTAEEFIDSGNLDASLLHQLVN